MDDLLLEAMHLIGNYPQLSDYEIGIRLHDNCPLSFCISSVCKKNDRSYQSCVNDEESSDLGVFVDLAKEVRKIGFVPSPAYLWA